MIKFENTEVMNIENAMRGMRNPMNSWNKGDTSFDTWDGLTVGGNDLNLARKLRQAGTDHRKFLRQILVCVDITAPLFWWKQFDQYRISVTSNSCSTMHKIHSKEFTLDDFSISDLSAYDSLYNCEEPFGYNRMECIISWLNELRHSYNTTKDKKYWQAMIELLPSAYNQKRTVTMTYENVLNMYNARKNHKLSEWHELCNWAESELDYFYEICLEEVEK